MWVYKRIDMDLSGPRPSGFIGCHLRAFGARGRTLTVIFLGNMKVYWDERYRYLLLVKLCMFWGVWRGRNQYRTTTSLTFTDITPKNAGRLMLQAP